ncbi:MAG: dTDP-4-dehydrorhamnose 3,5-epimerase [Microcella sp.]|nr:dTDP-4-dehydrorhamnose 3,5-epimerase [Microcella sp.]
MQIRELGIAGAVEFTPRQFPDDRGLFTEWYRFDTLAEAIGHPLDLRQANISVSRRGVVRGIHFADLPPSQAKYITVPHGAILDYVVDIRVGSPTFGQSEVVRLDSVDRRSLYVAEGLGHCFVALDDDTVVTYLVNDVFRPDREHAITPLDDEIGLELPFARDELLLSPKDVAAPTLAEAQRLGTLPLWSDSVEHLRSLDERWAAMR